MSISLSRVYGLLSLILLIYLNRWYAEDSPHPGHDTLYIQSINQGVVLIQIITRLSWWVTHSTSGVDLLTFIRRRLGLMASTPEGLQRRIDALASFCDLRQLMVNLGKTKVLIFNASKSSLTELHFHYKGEEIEITTTYTYLGVQFTGPRFSMRHDLLPRISKGYGFLAIIERQCFLGWFQDTSSKRYLMEAIIRSIVLYGSEI
jgi:hypothetical protein